MAKRLNTAYISVHLQKIIFAFLIFSCSVSEAVVKIDTKLIVKIHTIAENYKWEKDKVYPDFVNFKEQFQVLSKNFPTWIKSTFLLNNNINIVVKGYEIDELGMTHINYNVYYKHILVEHYIIKTHEKNGKVVSFNTELNPMENISESVNITKKRAFDVALSVIPSKEYNWINDETGNNDSLNPFSEFRVLKISLKGNIQHKLVYRFDIYSLTPLKRAFIYIDAASGKVLKTVNRICEIDINATAQTKYSGTQTIKTTKPSINYVLRESGRGQGIETYNMQNGTNYTNALDFTDADNVWNNINANQDEVATDAHWGAEKTYDFYFTKFARNSFDNGGSKIKSYIHYNQNYNNAFWDGSRVTYGDGDGVLNLPYVSLDVCGHEITHAVTQKTADLIYIGESGALNESFSDIFGKAIDFYGYNTITGWRMGAKITTDGNGIRSFDNPKIFQDPSNYNGQYWADTNSIHVNSSVQNHWFYILAMGKSGTNDMGNSFSVSGIGVDKATRIAYRNLTRYLTPSSNYKDANFYSVLSAIDLYGNCSAEVIATANAWYAVGVGATPNFGVLADFESDKVYSCSTPTTINFKNNSLNANTYKWDFGDGSSSIVKDPVKTYTVSGTYSVTLTATGGSCTILPSITSKNELIKVENVGPPVSPSCLPNIVYSNTCCGYGITNVTLNTINHTTPSILDGNKDFSCIVSTTLLKGRKYTIKVETDNSYSKKHSSGAWIDYNNNGIFESTENILTSESMLLHQNQFIIPYNAVENTLLRMRVGASVAKYPKPDGCSDIYFGQFEDYSVRIQNTQVTIPSANFESNVRKARPLQPVQFKDLTENIPTTWVWSFPGGNPSISNAQNPIVTYAALGNYNVILISTNSNGSDTIVKANYIKVENFVNMCSIDEINLNSAKVYDSGGIEGNFNANELCNLLIKPSCASSVVLKLKTLALDDGFTILRVYDGPTILDSLIADITGTIFPDSIVSKSGQMLLVFESDYYPSYNAGFEAEYYSIMPSTITNANFTISNINPPINDDVKFTAPENLSIKKHLWYFANEALSTDGNPVHAFSTSGVNQIKHKISNCFVADSLTKIINVQNAPILSYSPSTFEVVLNVGDSTIRNLRIRNSGLGDLAYNAFATQHIDQTSIINYTVVGAKTQHIFNNIASQYLEVTVTVNGDFENSLWIEEANVFIEGTFIDNLSQLRYRTNGFDMTQTYTFAGLQLANWLSDGSLRVDILNSKDVDVKVGGTDEHKVQIKNNVAQKWLEIHSTSILGLAQNKDLPVKFNAKNLGVGIYNSFVTLKTNSLTNPLITIPAVLTVLSNPIVNFSANPRFIAKGGTVQFTDLSVNTPTGWVWSFPGATPSTSIDRNPIVTYTNTGEFDVFLTVSNINGSSTQSKTKYIWSENTFNICQTTFSGFHTGRIYDEGGTAKFPDNSVCSFLIAPLCARAIALNFQELDLGNNSSLRIYNGTSTSAPLIISVDPSNIPAKIVANSGKMFLEFIGTPSNTQNSQGFMANWTSTITSTPPNVNFNISNSNPALYEPVQFTYLSTNFINQWLWKFSDGSSSIDQSPGKSFSTSGINTITLIGSNCFSSTSFAKNITVLSPLVLPVAQFKTLNTIIQPNTTIQFMDFSMYTATGWVWSFAGGNPSTSILQNPSVTYDANGNYAVSLTVSNINGSHTLVKQNYINVTNADLMCKNNFSTSISGTIFDSGGPPNASGDSTNCFFLINPECATSITLDLVNLDLGNAGILEIFNGSTPSAPIVFSSKTSTVLGTYLANTGKMLLSFSATTNSGNNQGFEANWSAAINCNHNPTLVANNSVFADFDIFPNPNDGNFMLKGNFLIGNKLNVKIFDLLGKVQFESQFTNENDWLFIPLLNLPLGTYLIEIHNGKQSKTKKITFWK